MSRLSRTATRLTGTITIKGPAALTWSRPAGFLLNPAQEAFRASHDRRRDDLWLVIAVTDGEEVGERLVATGWQLQREYPLFGALHRAFPPEGAGYRTADLGAGGQAALDRAAGEFHRLSTRIGGGLHEEETAALLGWPGSGRAVVTRHGIRSYALRAANPAAADDRAGGAAPAGAG